MDFQFLLSNLCETSYTAVVHEAFNTRVSKPGTDDSDFAYRDRSDISEAFPNEQRLVTRA